MIRKALLGAAIAASMFAGETWALPLAGTTVTANLNGSGSEVGTVDGPGNNTIAVTDGIDPEFVAGYVDGALTAMYVDIGLDGVFTFYANRVFTGPFFLTFDFTSLNSEITGFVLDDASTVSGTPALSAIDGDSVSADLSTVTSSEFGTVTGHLTFAAEVPEPSSIALLGLGVAMLGLRRRKS